MVQLNAVPDSIRWSKVPGSQIQQLCIVGHLTDLKQEEEKKTPKIVERTEDSLMEVGTTSFFRALGNS